jgi:hypothetical protein
MMLAALASPALAAAPPVTVHAVSTHATIEGRTVAMEFLIGLKPGVDLQVAAAKLLEALRVRGVLTTRCSV